MKVKEFLQELRHDELVAAIGQAERQTSGEIRVFVSRKKTIDPVAAAQEQFVRLGMTKTRERNAVLIFIAPRSCKFAVVGDEGVHVRCGEGFWRDLAAAMAGHFRKSEFTEGLLQGVCKAGELLALHFPPGPDDLNELSDQVEHD